MKIINTNFLNYNNKQKLNYFNTPNNNNNQQFDYNKTLNPAEMLGRSQINFTAKKKKPDDQKLQEYDERFIDTLAKSLRLTDNDKLRLDNAVQNFLKTRNCKYINDLKGFSNTDIQSDFMAEVGNEICYSDNDFDIFADAFCDRIYCPDEYEYNPVVDLYKKDFEVIDCILDKYDCDNGKKYYIFDSLADVANKKKCNNIFELFNNGNKFASKFIKILCNNDYNKIYLTDKKIDYNTACNITLDFAAMAKKSEDERHSVISSPWKRTNFMHEQSKDIKIACRIAKQYNLASDEFLQDAEDNYLGIFFSDIKKDEETGCFVDKYDIKETEKYNDILEHINKRHKNVSNQQIAYELLDKYKLPRGAFKFIINTISEVDASEDEDWDT
jgi:hypothetical protein